MSGWKRKRFWSRAHVAPREAGFAVLLDERPVHTPARAALVVPTRALAEAVAAEWDAQEGEIRPLTMPMTRSANAALDKVAPQFAEVAAHIAAYGETDLLCHRADGPEPLVERQAEAWDPLLDWARSALRAPLVSTVGVMAVTQPPESLAALAARVAAQDAFALTALADLVALSGSLVIGLAAQDGVLPPEELWRRSRIDETWQESQWGIDAEAAAVASRKRGEFLHAAAFHRLSRPAA
jgi:chaperone required for assembly of F1-ATPase